MAWAKFDDALTRSRKIRALSAEAGWLWFLAIVDCCGNTSDGEIDGESLRDLVRRVKPSTVAELVKAGMLHDRPGCPSEVCPAYLDGLPPSNDEEAVKAADMYFVHDFLEWQLSADEWERKRRQNAERQRKWRERKEPPDER